MAYRKDEDLEFLKHCSNGDLSPLVEVLTRDKDGNRRPHEELTTHERFKEHEPNHQKYWELIAAEIQCFGANTLATLGRGGKGVRYREILIDVCKHLKVKTNFDYSVHEIERALLVKIMEDVIETLSVEEIADALQELKLETTDPSKQAAIADIQAAARSGGSFTYRLSQFVASAIGKKVRPRRFKLASKLAAKFGLVRVAAFIGGPPWWLYMAVFAAIEAAGPALRVTWRAVVFVAALRQGHELAKDGNLGSPGEIHPCKRQHVVVVEDGGVTEMQAILRREKQETVQVLSKSQAESLTFGDEPIRLKALYSIHPLTQDIYFRQAEIRQRLFDERVLEAASILEAIGAKHVRIESERALSKVAAAKVGIKIGPFNTEAHGESETKENHTAQFDITFKRSARRDGVAIDESILQRSVWYQDEPYFRKILDSLQRRRVKKIEFDHEFDQEIRVDGELELSVLENLEISVSGDVKDYQAERFSAFAEF